MPLVPTQTVELVVLSLVIGAIGASLIAGDAVEVLEPESWVGRELPVLDNIDIADSLSSGHWTVLLVHYDCPRCKERIGRFSKLKGRLAIIQVPPYGELSTGDGAVMGRLTDSTEWFVETPTVLTLIDGRVVNVSQ